MLVESSQYTYWTTNPKPLHEIVNRSNRMIMAFQYRHCLHPMQQMLDQEAVHFVYNVVRNVRNEADMFNPKFTRIGYNLREGTFLAQIWECHVADVFS